MFGCRSFNESSRKFIFNGVDEFGSPSDVRFELPYLSGCAIVNFKSEFLSVPSFEKFYYRADVLHFLLSQIGFV